MAVWQGAIIFKFTSSRVTSRTPLSCPSSSPPVPVMNLDSGRQWVTLYPNFLSQICLPTAEFTCFWAFFVSGSTFKNLSPMCQLIYYCVYFSSDYLKQIWSFLRQCAAALFRPYFWKWLASCISIYFRPHCISSDLSLVRLDTISPLQFGLGRMISSLSHANNKWTDYIQFETSGA